MANQETAGEMPAQSLPAQSKPRSSSQRAGGEKRRRARQSRNDANGSAPNVVPDDALAFEKALRLLQNAKVQGLMSREPLRRAFHSGKLRGYIKGKRNIYFEPGPIFDLIGGVPVGDLETVDQALVRHYEASEFNTPITALAAGLATNLSKARQVFHDWIETRRDPLVAARIEAKKRAEAAREEASKPAPSSRCEACGRTDEQAAKDDAGINLAILGRKESPNASEMLALSEFQEQKCTGCWKWLPSAPAASMRARLRGEET